MDLNAEPLSDRQVFLEGLATLQEHAAAQLGFSRELAHLLHASPARMSVETLAPAMPVRSVYELGEAQSIGVLNWSPVTIQVGFAGRSATAGNGIPVPAGSWLVLPLACNMLDLGAAPADLTLAGEAHVGIIRFDHRQELAAGSLGGPAIPIGETLLATGSVANPAVGATIARIASPGAGVYLVEGSTAINLAGFSAPADNMQLRRGATVIGALASGGVPVAFRVPKLTVAAGEDIAIVCTTGDSVDYYAQMTATRVA